MSEYEYKKTPYKTGFNRADNGTRTRGLNLGKVALYQLSYVRKKSSKDFVGDVGIEPTTPSV